MTHGFLHLSALPDNGRRLFCTTGTNASPKKKQRLPRNHYQYWCQLLMTFLPFSAVLVIFNSLIDTWLRFTAKPLRELLLALTARCHSGRVLWHLLQEAIEVLG